MQVAALGQTESLVRIQELRIETHLAIRPLVIEALANLAPLLRASRILEEKGVVGEPAASKQAARQAIASGRSRRLVLRS